MHTTKDGEIELDLPSLPSALLRLALSDLEKVEADPNYRVDMLEWHHPRNGLCSVCLAGAVIARALDPSQRYKSSMFTKTTVLKFEALDNMRSGHVGIAIFILASDEERDNFNRSKFNRNKFNCDVPNYDTSPGMFRHRLNQLANELEKNGL